MIDKHFIGGFCGGVSGTLAAYPLDTVKVRLQAGDAAGHFSKAEKSFDALKLKDILKVSYRHNLKQLFRGVASPLVTLAPANALAFY